jgi:hypothetical protein
MLCPLGFLSAIFPPKSSKSVSAVPQSYMDSSTGWTGSALRTNIKKKSRSTKMNHSINNDDEDAYEGGARGGATIDISLPQEEISEAAKGGDTSATSIVEDEKVTSQESIQQPVVDDSSVTLPNRTTDYTELPSRLDEVHDKLDPDIALRSTIITPSEVWIKTYQEGLMRPLTSTTLNTDDLITEKCAAFDLLDALSRSGANSLTDVALHIVIASTHNFDKSILDTVVQDNINPIDRAERSCLILASTLHDTAAATLLKDDQVLKISGTSPSLFLA